MLLFRTALLTVFLICACQAKLYLLNGTYATTTSSAHPRGSVVEDTPWLVQGARLNYTFSNKGALSVNITGVLETATLVIEEGVHSVPTPARLTNTYPIRLNLRISNAKYAMPPKKQLESAVLDFSNHTCTSYGDKTGCTHSSMLATALQAIWSDSGNRKELL